MELGGLLMDLPSQLKMQVDVTTVEMLRPEIRARVLSLGHAFVRDDRLDFRHLYRIEAVDFVTSRGCLDADTKQRPAWTSACGSQFPIRRPVRVL